MPRTLLILNRLDVVQATVRALQFREQLGSDAVFALRTPQWLQGMQAWWPRRRWLRWPADAATAWACAGRERKIARQAADFDVVYSVGVPSIELHRRLLDARSRAGFKLVNDVVDAQWLPWFRQFGWDHLDQMLADSDAVFVTNQYTAEHARQHCRHVFEIPDSPQVEAFDALRDRFRPPDDEIRIGWIGGRDTVFSLHGLQETLEQLAGLRPQIHLRVLGSPEDRLPRFEKVRWSVVERYDQAAMVREALQMHIGVFPQFHVSESVCRGSLKAKIYMAAGAAAVCESIGENLELIEHRRNGLLAVGATQWLESLTWLVDEPTQRRQVAAAGLQTIRDHFTAEKVGAILREALESVAQLPPRDASADGAGGGAP